jgi:hypothetical protein
MAFPSVSYVPVTYLVDFEEPENMMPDNVDSRSRLSCSLLERSSRREAVHAPSPASLLHFIDLFELPRGDVFHLLLYQKADNGFRKQEIPDNEL